MMEPLVQHEVQQHLPVVSVLNFFGKKLPLQVLYTIVNTSPDETLLPKYRHLGEM